MVRVSPRHVVYLTVAAALLPISVARAQTAPTTAAAPATSAPAPAPQPLDTGVGDLAPMPELGVDWPDPAKIDAAPAATGPTEVKGIAADKAQHYRTTLEGAESLGATFKTRFEQLSALVTNQGKLANAAQINRRAQDDEDLVRQLLAAQGHYDGRVVTTVDSNPESGETRVHVKVTPGDAYQVSSVALPGLDAAGKDAPRLTQDFAVKAGDTVNADAVQNSVAAFKVELGRQGYPFAKVGEPEVAIDHQTNKAILTVAITPGEHAKFGKIVPTGTRPPLYRAPPADDRPLPSRPAI